MAGLSRPSTPSSQDVNARDKFTLRPAFGRTGVRGHDEEKLSERSSVPDVVRQHARPDADLAQRLGIFLIVVGAENQIGIGGTM